jgi:hypothetical protein
MKTKPFPGFDHLFLVRDPLSNRAFRGRVEPAVHTIELTRGESSFDTPLSVAWAMGGRSPSDIIWTTCANLLIAHQRVNDILQEAGFSGWQTYPVSVIDKSGTRHDDYLGLQVTGRCGPSEAARSTIYLEEYPGGWFPHLLGHYFDENTWDGNDIFMHARDSKGRPTGHIITTEGVRDAFRRVKIKNIWFEPLSELSVSSSVYEIGLADLLPHDFQQRVNALYAEQGIPRPR